MQKVNGGMMQGNLTNVIYYLIKLSFILNVLKNHEGAHIGKGSVNSWMHRHQTRQNIQV